MKLILSVLSIDKSSNIPVYLQIVNQIIQAIQQGILKPGYKLPGSRTLSSAIDLNRNTLVAAIDELQSQGWIETLPAKGSIISSKLPEIHPRPWSAKVSPKYKNSPLRTFQNNQQTYLTSSHQFKYHFDDGLPDIRLAPLDKLGRYYKSFLVAPQKKSFMYYDTHLAGSLLLRNALKDFLFESRGIECSVEEIMITRGAIMAFYLMAQLLIEPGDLVLAGDSSYLIVEQIVKKRGGRIKQIKVDQDGLDVSRIEKIAKKEAIKLIYTVPHHHYPTTVSLSPKRRIQLIQCAQKYGFAVIEDDYDYDFHYSGSPILPLKSADPFGHIAYVSSMSKTLAPAFRMGFMVAPKHLIENACRVRRFIDRQGDNILERSVAMLFKEGDIRRHHRKSLIAYQKRRDLSCLLLKKHLGNLLEFDVPEGGLAIWTKWDPKFDLSGFRERVIEKGCYLSKADKFSSNNIRMGFASMNEEEITKAVKILKSCI